MIHYDFHSHMIFFSLSEERAKYNILKKFCYKISYFILLKNLNKQK